MRNLAKFVILAGVMLGGLAQPLSALAADYTIVLDHMKFGPLPDALHVGDTITWQNNDIFRHTATARDKSFDVDLPPKSTSTMTVRAAGSVAFFCKFHPGMKGTLVIAR